MNFLSFSFTFFFIFQLLIFCTKDTVAENLTEQFLRAAELKGRNDRFENVYIIGKVIAKCINDNYRNKIADSCISGEALNILETKINENIEIFILFNRNDQSFSTNPGVELQKLIVTFRNFVEETNEVNYKDILETCAKTNPYKTLENLLTNLEVKYYFYNQSAAYNHDVRPFRRLKESWNSYILMYSAFSGICKAFGTSEQTLPKKIKEFDKFMKEQEIARKETFLHTTVKAMANKEFHNKNILIEDLKYFRDLLNEMFEDLNLFAVVSIPNGNIFIPLTTLPTSYLYHITNMGAHILIYPTLPSNTYKHIRETDSSLLNFNYNKVGSLFGKGPYCSLRPNGTLILPKFYVDIALTCNERLSCILFESPLVEAATTNANVFLRNSNIDCGWFSSKDLFLLAKNTPKNDLKYEKKDKHFINIYLTANTRLNNSVFHVSNPYVYENQFFKI